MDNALTRTERQLDELRQRSSSCLVSYSGGKDSRVVADLVCRKFEHVEAFFMYLVPDLACVEEALDFGRKRWGFKIHMIPHWDTWHKHKYGVFCKDHLEIQEVKLEQIHDWMMHKTGIGLIANGAKNSDSMWRRRQLGTWGKKDNMVYPIQKWNKLQVLGYLKSRGIPLPDSSNRQATGIGLTDPSVLWLYDKNPGDYARLINQPGDHRHLGDYAKLLMEYKFAHAVVKRREFFGAMHEGLFDGETRPTKE